MELVSARTVVRPCHLTFARSVVWCRVSLRRFLPGEWSQGPSPDAVLLQDYSKANTGNLSK